MPAGNLDERQDSVKIIFDDEDRSKGSGTDSMNVYFLNEHPVCSSTTAVGDRALSHTGWVDRDVRPRSPTDRTAGAAPQAARAPSDRAEHIRCP
jgi:hypothetical protein